MMKRAIRGARRPLASRSAGIGVVLATLCLGACDPDGDPAQPSGSQAGIVFPVQPGTSGERDVMQALLFGRLVADDGCLRIQDRTGDAGYVPIWPPEFSVRTTGGVPEVLDEAGRPRVRVGQEIRVSGGETGAGRGIRVMLDGVERELPDRCAGPYWIVGSEVRPLAPGETPRL